MPIDHEGDPNATQAPSPAPGPGVAPIARVPAGGDARNADSVKQMAEVAADFTAYIQASVRLENPQTPSTTSGIGRMFTEVDHVGAGGGTVKPSAGIALSGYRYMVLITLAGATGVAKFKVSLDGGKTYGAEQTTAASYSDPSGVTIAFSGTFVLDDTYAWRGCDTPLALWTDPSGRARECVDHNGFMHGLLTSYREDWRNEPTSAFAAGSTDVLYPGNSKWKYTLGNASSTDPTMALQSPNADHLGNFNSVLITGGDDAPTNNGMVTSRPLVRAGTGSTGIAWMEQLVRFPAFASGTVNIGFGAGTIASLGSNTSDHACFRSTAGGNWFAAMADGGGAATSIDTGIAPNVGAASDWQLLRVEYYGPSTQLAIALSANSVVRFLIDGEQAAIFVNESRRPLGLIYPSFGQFDPGAVTPNQLEVGPMIYGVNWLDDPVRM